MATTKNQGPSGLLTYKPVYRGRFAPPLRPRSPWRGSPRTRRSSTRPRGFGEPERESLPLGKMCRCVAARKRGSANFVPPGSRRRADGPRSFMRAASSKCWSQQPMRRRFRRPPLGDYTTNIARSSATNRDKACAVLTYSGEAAALVSLESGSRGCMRGNNTCWSCTPARDRVRAYAARRAAGGGKGSH